MLTQIVLGNDPITMEEKVMQHLEDFGAESGRLAGPVQHIELGVQDTIIENIDHDVSPSWGAGPHW
jgi:hypothetical protein